MYELEIKRTIASAHRLRGYDGACCNLHGHNYEITAVLRARELDAIGIGVDFKKLKGEVDRLLDGYDHAFLNEHPDFVEVNPTSENIARTLYRKLAERMNDGNVKVQAIKVGESSTSCATYFED